MRKEFKVNQIVSVNQFSDIDEARITKHIEKFEVTKRTAKFVTVKSLLTGKEKRCKVQTCHSITSESLEFDWETVLIA